ncbi:MAG: S-layer homology domain-containing protein, partial [Oscillospiraceae bacterium]|nr:S-layer homology domain-containing protein [Oscillospiraceae bacterium]
TREQLATLLWRFAGEPSVGDAALGVPIPAFTDADSISDWAKAAVAWAVSSGIINGYPDGTVNPGGSATRAEVAAMMGRYVKGA